MIPLLSFWGPAITGTANLAFAQDFASAVELAPQVIKESGCPVDISSAKAFLDLNSFGKPEYSRVYITYKNVSGKNVYSVNFRVRFTNEEGANLGTFQGSRTATVTPDAEGSEKWKKAGAINPKITSYKVRVLQVKFEDGSQWESEVINNVGRTQQQQDPQQNQDQGQDQGGGEDLFRPASNSTQQPVQRMPAAVPNQEAPGMSQGPGPDVAPDQYPPPGPQQSPNTTPSLPEPAPQQVPQQAPDSASGPGGIVNPNDDGDEQGDAFSR